MISFSGRSDSPSRKSWTIPLVASDWQNGGMLLFVMRIGLMNRPSRLCIRFLFCLHRAAHRRGGFFNLFPGGNCHDMMARGCSNDSSFSSAENPVNRQISTLWLAGPDVLRRPRRHTRHNWVDKLMNKIKSTFSKKRGWFEWQCFRGKCTSVSKTSDIQAWLEFSPRSASQRVLDFGLV